MFVLPPPPSYGANKLYPPGGGLVETNNTVEHHEGPEFQLVLGEGTYRLRDEMQLAIPPPHPSDLPLPNNNPLATTVDLPKIGTKLSLASLAPRRPPSQALHRLATTNSARSNVPHSISEEAPQSLPGDEESHLKSNGTDSLTSAVTLVFGSENPALTLTNGEKTKDAAKKKKPKNNIIKSNSSFVSRVIPHESLQKRLTDRRADGLFAFANIDRAIQWLDLSAETKAEHLTKILFTKANPLCHDINQHTKSATNLDVIFGYNTSDIIWYEPMSQKYARLNKNGAINSSAISSIYWLPNSENLFIAAHMDGALVVYDKEKEDAPFVPEDSTVNGLENGHGVPHLSSMEIKKSVQSRNQKANPVSYWRVGRQKINSMAFSPDGSHLAVVSEDGTLKIIEFHRENLIDVYRSYYGGLISVTWSPDGRYILTGGQDDLVSIWSFADGGLVARCQGHSSWVTDVKFDPWRCDDRDYRFGSVGEDCRLLLWDFSVGMLGRPKTLSMRQRTSVSTAPIPRKESTTNSIHTPLQATGDVSAADAITNGAAIHEVDSRSSTAVLPPVMSKKVGKNPMSWLGFEADCIMAVCSEGHIWTWNRPNEGALDDPVTGP